MSSSVQLPSKQKAALTEKIGDSVEVIQYTDIDTPQITSPTDVIIKNKYAGVNYIESYFRKGIYPIASFPYIFGREASGIIAAVGDKVTKYKVGDKVAYVNPSTFAQYSKIDESKVQVLKLPESIGDDQLKLYGSFFIQGLTALTFVHEAYEVKKNDFILVWAAAGGVGQILVQLGRLIGANVIAVASTNEKLDIAKGLGAKYLINSSKDDVLARVKEITNDNGVAASFDSVGKDTFEISLAALARKGTLVSFGNSSGTVDPLSINRLSAKNIKLARPTVMNYVVTQDEWDFYTEKFLKYIKDGDIKVEITKTYPLSQYKQAATDLESRKTTGKLALEIPQ